ncbi:arylsulfatase H-like [Gastrophryne carolinensis]
MATLLGAATGMGQMMLGNRYDYLPCDFEKRTLALAVVEAIARKTGTTYTFTQIVGRILMAIVYSAAYLCIGEAHSKPNFVLIMADDLGIGDLGCYGNDTIRTPNIDRMAKEGVKLTQHLAAAPLCTPSRAAFMTGRQAFRSGMNSHDEGPVLTWVGVPGGLPTNETTFAKILQKEGYFTGIIGKWHLGVNCDFLNDHCHHPLNHGFDYFYGTPFSLYNECQPGGPPDIFTPFKARLMFVTQLIACAIITMVIVKYTKLFAVSGKLIFYCALFGTLFFMSWYIKYGFSHYWNCIVMRNHEVVEQPMNTPRMAAHMIKETRQFIERYKDGPFLLVVSFLHVHTPLDTTTSFIGRSKHGIYGDNVEEMDFMVGLVLDAIENTGVKNNTLIYFASDHGGQLESKDGNIQTGGWNGIYRGGKGMAGWEGGIRVPGIFTWPGVIPSNTEVDEPTSLMDIFPTLVHLGGGELPNDRIIDGRDLFPLVTQKTAHSEHEFLFHYCGNYLHAARWHEKQSGAVWKVHYATPVFFPEGAVGCYNRFTCGCDANHVVHHDPPLLFELSADPSESNQLKSHTDPLYKEVLDRIKAAVVEHQKTISVVPQQLSFYNNLWRPWLQPCCGIFPFCWCQQEDLNDNDLM